jgi:hypothetical protein
MKMPTHIPLHDPAQAAQAMVTWKRDQPDDYYRRLPGFVIHTPTPQILDLVEALVDALLQANK